MTKARRDIIDVNVTRYYHCISSCVRQGFYCETYGDLRRIWLRKRLRRLAKQFSLDVCAFAFMSNHFHVIVRLNPDLSGGWSNEEVVRRWARVCPPRDSSNRPLRVTDDWVAGQLQDEQRVSELRQRLDDLGWFMRMLKQPIAQRANMEDGVWGHFWAGRYKSIPIMDGELGVARACAYVDLNPFAANETEYPEGSANSSINHRLHRFRQWQRLGTEHSKIHDRSEQKPSEEEWLCPLEFGRVGHSRSSTGMFSSFNFEDYVALIEVSSRRNGKFRRRVNTTNGTIRDRWGLDPASWTDSIGRIERFFVGA